LRREFEEAEGKERQKVEEESEELKRELDAKVRELATVKVEFQLCKEKLQK